MGKKVCGVIAAIILLAMAQPVWAASAGDPTGEVLNGWFKDSFSVSIDYGDGSCSGPGIVNNYVYKAGFAQDGVHDYHFLADSLDNIFLAIDGGGPMQLISPPCPLDIPSVIRDINGVQLDALPPAVDITSPSDGIGTVSDNYTVIGNVTDSASGVQSVRAIINGSPGPFGTVSGNSYSVVVGLGFGANHISIVGTDNVGHSANSNSINITRSSGGSTPSSGPTGASRSATSPAQTPVPTHSIYRPSSAPGDTGATLFSPDLPSLRRTALASDDNKTKNLDLSLAGLCILGIIVLLLLMLMGAYVYSERVLGNRHGLRRKIVIMVIMPSLIPLLGLGAFGFLQLSASTKSSLSDQLSRASQDTAIKLEREISARRTVFISDANSILQIDQQYGRDNSKLDHQKDACSGVVRREAPRAHYDQVIADPSCAPFLAGFAQLLAPGPDSVNDYLAAVNDGYLRSQSSLKSNEQQRVNETLNSEKVYYPGLKDVLIVDKNSQTVARLLPNGAIDQNQKLISSAQKLNVSSLTTSKLGRDLLFGYSVSNSKSSHLGAIVVDFNPDNNQFLRPIWKSTPLPSSQDVALIIDDKGGDCISQNRNKQIGDGEIEIDSP